MENTRPIRLLIGTKDMELSDVHKFPSIYKAKQPLVAKKVTKTSKKGKSFQQTVYVAQKVDKNKLDLRNLTDADIEDYKRKPQTLMNYLKMTAPIAKHWYKTTALNSVGVDFDDAKQEADISAYKALMAYKGGKGKQASLSTLVYTSIRNKFYNLYKTASNAKKKQTTGSFDNIANVASVVDDNTKVEIKEAQAKIRAGIKAWSERGGIDNAEYQSLFNDWTAGMSLAEMAKKRKVSRPMISGKFKRIIYKVIEANGYTKDEVSKEQGGKEKYRTKKAEGDLTTGMLILGNTLARDIGEIPLFPSDYISEAIGNAGIIKMKAFKKLVSKIKDRKQEKLLFRYMKNFDEFTAPFVEWASKFKFADIGNTNQAGFEIQDTRVVIYDSDSLPVMQYNVILSLISEFIREDSSIMEYLITVSPESCDQVSRRYKKEFGAVLHDNPIVACATLNAFVSLFESLGYNDRTLDRYKKVLPNKKSEDLDYLYTKLFNGV